MKIEFELQVFDTKSYAKALIIGTAPQHKPYVKIDYTDGYDGRRHDLSIKDRDPERFAVNILKALKSKRLK